MTEHHDYEIRAAEVADLEAISHLVSELTERHIAAGLDPSAKQALLENMTVDGLKALIARGCAYHVAVQQDLIVGVIGFLEQRHLYHLFVADDHQRQGIARRLWLSVLSHNKQSNTRVEISVNAAADTRLFYEKLGFVALTTEQMRNGIRTIAMKYTEPN